MAHFIREWCFVADFSIKGVNNQIEADGQEEVGTCAAAWRIARPALQS
jgi:hypothetical protein